MIAPSQICFEDWNKIIVSSEIKPHLIVKFMFSKNATKIDEIFTLYLTVTTYCQNDGEVLPIFVAFSENLNFKLISLQVSGLVLSGLSIWTYVGHAAFLAIIPNVTYKIVIYLTFATGKDLYQV